MMDDWSRPHGGLHLIGMVPAFTAIPTAHAGSPRFHSPTAQRRARPVPESFPFPDRCLPSTLGNVVCDDAGGHLVALPLSATVGSVVFADGIRAPCSLKPCFFP